MRELCQPQHGEHNSEELLSGSGATEALLSSGRETFQKVWDAQELIYLNLKNSSRMENKKEKERQKCARFEDYFFFIKIPSIKTNKENQVIFWSVYFT